MNKRQMYRRVLEIEDELREKYAEIDNLNRLFPYFKSPSVRVLEEEVDELIEELEGLHNKVEHDL